jgi:predicted aspartyl protease
VELEKDYAFAYAAMGVAHMKKGNDSKARNYAEKALTLNPDSNTTKLASRVIEGAIRPVRRVDSKSVTVPIGKQGHVFVDVRFGKRGKPQTFLLDTGATHTVVRPELLPDIEKNTKVTLLGTGLVSLADGSRRHVNRYRVSNVYLDKLYLGAIEVHVFQGKAGNIPNLLGINSLKKVTVSMNNTAGKAEIKLNSQ